MFHAMFLDDDEPTLLDCEAIISEEFLGSLICLSLLHVVEGKLSAFATRGTTEDEAIVKGEGGGGGGGRGRGKLARRPYGWRKNDHIRR